MNGYTFPLTERCGLVQNYALTTVYRYGAIVGSLFSNVHYPVCYIDLRAYFTYMTYFH